MCEEFPLSLVEQVVPIIDLMARTSAHFARLRDFIKLEFPPGFPIKIGTIQSSRGAPNKGPNGKGQTCLEFSVIYRSVLVLSSFCTSK